MNKAPAGGMLSVVNNQFYSGGEFMPITGEFCGNGKNKVSMSRFNNAAHLAKINGYLLRFRDGRFELVKNGNVYFGAANLHTLEKILLA